VPGEQRSFLDDRRLVSYLCHSFRRLLDAHAQIAVGVTYHEQTHRNRKRSPEAVIRQGAGI